MFAPDRKNESDSDASSFDDDMEKFGIKKVCIDYFHYRGFRYTNMKDAIAQARRDEISHEGERSS